MYRKAGFANGSAFADYQASPFNQFLHLDLVQFSVVGGRHPYELTYRRRA